MSKCISVHGEYSEHEYTGQNPACDYCGQVSEMIAYDQLQAMRAALVAIQELHKREEVTDIHGDHQARCADCHQWYPCPTRKLADEALTDRMARTNQGENK